MRLAALLVFAGVCAAQPVITDLQPRGAQKGRPFLLNVVGRYLDGAKVESTMPATFTPMAAEKGIMGATFLVEPAAEIGVGVIALGIWYNKNRDRFARWRDASLPAGLRRLRPH